jgi:hypothetical protein
LIDRGAHQRAAGGSQVQIAPGRLEGLLCLRGAERGTFVGVLAVNQALDGLAAVDEGLARVVELRYLAG